MERLHSLPLLANLSAQNNQHCSATTESQPVCSGHEAGGRPISCMLSIMHNIMAVTSKQTATEAQRHIPRVSSATATAAAASKTTATARIDRMSASQTGVSNERCTLLQELLSRAPDKG